MMSQSWHQSLQQPSYYPQQRQHQQMIYPQNQHVHEKAARPQPPSGMLNYGNPMLNRPVTWGDTNKSTCVSSAENNSEYFVPSVSLLQDPKWKEFYGSIQKWQAYYAMRGENPSKEHALLFEKYLVPIGLAKSSMFQSKVQEQQPVRAYPFRQQHTNEERDPSRGWPQTFKDYVYREKQAAKGTPFQDAMDRDLKFRAAEMEKTGKLWAVNWRIEPSRLPKLRADFEKNEHSLNQSNDSTTQEEVLKPVSLKIKRRRSRPWENGDVELNSFEIGKSENFDLKREKAKKTAKKQKKGKRDSLQNAKGLLKLQESNGFVTPKNGKKTASRSHTDLYGLDTSEPFSSQSDERLTQRAARFSSSGSRSADNGSVIRHDPNAAARQGRRVKAALQRAHEEGYDLDLSQFSIKGNATNLEKRFLRLTGVPHPSEVRPLPILKKALRMILNCWACSSDTTQRLSSECDLANDINKNGAVSYHWVCDQMKSVRQDLTVQHIKNDFVVDVYEAHARIALQQHDLDEFNQCLTQLLALYGNGFSRNNEHEFAGYHVLYLLFVRIKYSRHNSDLTNLITTMPASLRKATIVRHALAVRHAVEIGLYTSFYALYDCAPKLSGCFMDLMIDFVRHETMNVVLETFRRTIPLDALATEFLHLNIQDNERDRTIWKKLVINNDEIVMESNSLVNAKDSMPAFSRKFEWPVSGGDSVQRIESTVDF